MPASPSPFRSPQGDPVGFRVFGVAQPSPLTHDLHSEKKPRLLATATLPAPPLATTDPRSVSMDLSVLDTPCSWSHMASRGVMF